MLKNGTITQFTESQTQAGINEADNFQFDAAFKEYIATGDHKITGPTSYKASIFTWFVAGILVGKQLMIDNAQAEMEHWKEDKLHRQVSCNYFGCDQVAYSKDPDRCYEHTAISDRILDGNIKEYPAGLEPIKALCPRCKGHLAWHFKDRATCTACFYEIEMIDGIADPRGIATADHCTLHNSPKPCIHCKATGQSDPTH